MKITAIILLFVGVCLLLAWTVFRPNVVDHVGLNTARGLSSWLSYSIEFHPADGIKEAEFTATLTNVCPYKLSIILNDKEFHASFVVKPSSGPVVNLFDKEYREMLLTSIWSEPLTVLAPSNSIRWTVPLSSLVGEHDHPITEASLSGCTVSSEMTMSIAPKRWITRSYVSDNASQTSQSIQIP